MHGQHEDTANTPLTRVCEHKHAHMQTPTCTHAHVILHTHMHTHRDGHEHTLQVLLTCRDRLSLAPHTHTMCPPQDLSMPVSALPGTRSKSWGARTHHSEGHTVDLMLVFGLVLPKGAVPVATRGEGNSVVPTHARLEPTRACTLTPGAA